MHRFPRGEGTLVPDARRLHQRYGLRFADDGLMPPTCIGHKHRLRTENLCISVDHGPRSFPAWNVAMSSV